MSPPTSPGGRGLKRSASGETAEKRTGSQPLFSQQEPWKREINDLWAKQLAMMREINTLKVELGRREAARQREILAMRQELDVMRAEIFRLRQIAGGVVGKGEGETEEVVDGEVPRNDVIEPEDEPEDREVQIPSGGDEKVSLPIVGPDTSSSQ